MRFAAVTLAGIAAMAILAGASSAEIARGTAFSARVSAPPKVQIAGRMVFLRVIVQNNGAAIRPFCIDFSDDNGSWDIAMPGLSSWNSDTFCLALPGNTRKTLTARLIPARTGSRKMSITLGRAKVFKEFRKAIINDDNALFWEQQFVIVG